MKIVGLEGLRGYMCLWVIISHTVTMATLPFYKHYGIGKIIANGGIAVDVFISLSGFVIALLLHSQKEKYSSYIYRRFFRLFPAYVFALTVSILLIHISLDFLYALPWEHPKTQNRIELFNSANEYFWINTVSHLTLFHGLIPSQIVPNGVYAFLGQAWSLTLEWQFYLIAPILFKVVISTSKISRILIVISFIAIEFYMLDLIGHRASIFSNIILFILGIICFDLFEKLKEQKIDTMTYRFSILFWLLVLLVYKYNYHHGGLINVLGPTIWIISFLLLTTKVNIFGCSFIKTMLNTELSPRIVK